MGRGIIIETDNKRIYQFIRECYDEIPPTIKYTLKNLRNDIQFILSILRLRAEGWRDWQLLDAMKMLVLRYHFCQILFRDKQLDFKDYLVEKSKESEKASDPIIPASHFEYTNIRSELDPRERNLKDQFSFTRGFDIEHPDPFKFTLEPIFKEWSKNYEIINKQERNVLLDLEIIWGKPIPNIDLIKQAVDLNPKYARALYYLAKVYHKMKRRDEALEAINRCLEINPKFEEAINIKAKIIQQENN